MEYESQDGISFLHVLVTTGVDGRIFHTVHTPSALRYWNIQSDTHEEHCLGYSSFIVVYLFFGYVNFRNQRDVLSIGVSKFLRFISRTSVLIAYEKWEMFSFGAR